MDKEEKRIFVSLKAATILAGTGMGLLLGIIMGLSVSEVVKVIMASLTALLGVFLGFDKRSFSAMSEEEFRKDKQETLLTALRAGSFGLAVVAGILLGMWVRTNDIFTPSVKSQVKEWTDAGYDEKYALKLVAYQRLAINPTTGELGERTEVQRQGSSSLFSAEEVTSLCSAIDTSNWHSDWKLAREAMIDMKMPALTSLLNDMEVNIQDNKTRFEFLGGLRYLVCTMVFEKFNTNICTFGTDVERWKNYDASSQIALVVEKLPKENQQNLMNVLGKLVCQLESK